ncbi:haloacid dehalogenase-like hydrolase [Theileria parva strain Muguga]|uniref:Haloacid dehalogenase-like hydrolase n=1 Tax=Theileria parva TaxID=5875 RepID=Q4N6T8_THEPA|nr:haloacid dehalogenase-like hydrolase [Theileria parva strain Muguga]EAN34320.1 haloacid dehalogenase-like hydrolase [Theileria parva strain Muguga]|eukprot:XP_766603.1 hypothetical protein [Theileria parva strain Muguga]
MRYKFCSKFLFLFVIFLDLFCSNSLCAPISDFVKPDTPPKFFAIDIDGTFYINDETKFKRNVKALKLLKDKNVTPFFCTGRSFNAVKKIFGAEFQNESSYKLLPGIYSNGSLIYNSYGILIHKSVFKSDFIEKFIQFVNDKRYRNHVVFFGVVDIFSLESSVDPKDELTLDLDPIVKSDAQIKNEDITGIRIKKIDITVAGSSEDTDYVKFDEGDVTVLFPEKSLKDLSLKKLVESMGGKISECTYIGNELNDLKVMSFPDILSFAVGDAIDKIKDIAKWVLDLKHDECAFEKVVDLLYGEES